MQEGKEELAPYVWRIVISRYHDPHDSPESAWHLWIATTRLFHWIMLIANIVIVGCGNRRRADEEEEDDDDENDDDDDGDENDDDDEDDGERESSKGERGI